MTAPFSRAVYKRQLAITLKNLRGEITQQTAAEALGCTSGRIGHFERGRNVPTRSDVERLAELYRATDRAEELATLADQIRNAPRDGELVRLATTPSGFETYLALEQGAREVTEWATMTVPGLLQTREYATAVMSAHEAGLKRRELERRVEQRMRRQHMLRRSEDPPAITAVIDEAVLHRQVGSVEVLGAQLEHLVSMSTLHNVSIRVLPYDRIVSSALDGAFIIMHFGIPGDDGLVYYESRIGGTVVEDPDDIDDYLGVVDDLMDAALTEEDGRTTLETIRKELS